MGICFLAFSRNLMKLPRKYLYGMIFLGLIEIFSLPLIPVGEDAREKKNSES